MLNKGFTLEDVEKAYSIFEAMGVFSRVYILVGPPFVKDLKAAAIKWVRYAKKIGFKDIVLLGAYPMRETPVYDLWKMGEWIFFLKKYDFIEIIRLAQDIKPDIEFSSNGLEKFWRLVG